MAFMWTRLALSERLKGVKFYDAVALVICTSVTPVFMAIASSDTLDLTSDEGLYASLTARASEATLPSSTVDPNVINGVISDGTANFNSAYELLTYVMFATFMTIVCVMAFLQVRVVMQLTRSGTKMKSWDCLC
jgi:hypothetical protein